jgi:hypothetical protein
MINSFTRAKTVAVGLCAAAAIATVAAGTAAAATGHPARHDGPAATASSRPVVISCLMKHQVKPSMYTLACADGGALIKKMHWASWAGSAAFGSGTYSINTCTPSCVAGHFASFPILAALWRVEPLPGHRSVRYFTRLTLILTGNRSYKAGGKTFHLPQTLTQPLSEFGGGGG